MGEKVADPRSALATLFEGPLAFQHLADIVELRWRKFADDLAGIAAVVFLKERFVIEGIDLRRTAVHVEKDHVPRFGRKMGRLRRERVGGPGGGDGLIVEERLHRDTAKAHRAMAQHVSAIELARVELLTVHGVEAGVREDQRR
jgi:hypothetical protein